MTWSGFTEVFLLVSIGGYFFFSIFLGAFPNVLSQVPQKQWFQTAHRFTCTKNDVTLRDECTHHKAVFLQASLQFSSEVIYALTTSPRVPLNNTSEIPQRQSFQTGQCTVSFNSLKWMHTSDSIVLEWFFLGFISGYFTFCDSFQHVAKISLFHFQKNLVETLPNDERGITPSVECTHHKAVSQKASLSFCLRISPFTPYAWMCSQMSLRESAHDAVSKLRNKKKIFSVCDE